MASDVMDTTDSDHNYAQEVSRHRPTLNLTNANTPSKASPLPYPHSLRLTHGTSHPSDHLPSQRNPQQLRRHRSYTALPIESLVRKLSRQSLRPHDSQNIIRRRPSSIDLHRSPALRSDLFSNFTVRSGQRDEFRQGQNALSSPPSSRSQSTMSATPSRPDARLDQRSLRRSPSSIKSTTIHNPTIHWRHAADPGETSRNQASAGSSGVDEGYCEGDDDLSWLDNEDAATLGLAAHLRRRGLLRYRSSQEAAMQCATKLVRNEPRMRRRRKQKGRRLSTATNISQTTDLLSSSVLQLPPLASSPPQDASSSH